MNFADAAMQFDCAGAALVGVVSLPERPVARGVLVLVGGPQYRAGSHRQFTLLARHLAAAGVAAMRFDYRGMGDSGGAPRDFESVADDLRCAIDAFLLRVPALREIVVWGLCDGASAALLHGCGDRRVTGMVLLNPWVRTAASHARTTLRHYYLARLSDGAFWRKLLGGRLDWRAAARSLADLLSGTRAHAAGQAAPRAALPMTSGPAPAASVVRSAATVGTAPPPAASPASPPASSSSSASFTVGDRPTDGAAPSAAALPQRMLEALLRFEGKVLLITSGRDLTAREFLDLAAGSAQWRRALAQPRVSRQTLSEADHTFSCAAWRDQVAQLTADWVRSW